MAMNEVRHSQVRKQMVSLLESEDRAPKAVKSITTLRDPQVDWESISMDFVMGLLREKVRYDAIWVIVDRLTKSTNFLSIRENCPLEKLA